MLFAPVQLHGGVKPPANQVDAVLRGFNVLRNAGKALRPAHQKLKRVIRGDGVSGIVKLYRPLHRDEGVAGLLVDVYDAGVVGFAVGHLWALLAIKAVVFMPALRILRGAKAPV